MTDDTPQSTPAKPRCCHPGGCTCVLFHGMDVPDPDCVWFGIPRTPLPAPAKPKPAPQGITLEALAEAIRSAGQGQHHKRYSEAIAEHLIDHPVVGPLLRVEAIPPVRASERPWERPGWCDSEGRCWGFNATERAWRLRPAVWYQSEAERMAFRWLLPASAIPVPAEEGQS